MKPLQYLLRCRRRRVERGAVAVEFAVVLPLLALILFGVIEYGYALYVQQSLTNAAREGCRIAVLQTSSPPYSAAQARIDDMLGAAGIDNYDPPEFTDTDSNGVSSESIEVTVSLDYENASLTGFVPVPVGKLKGHCSMRKEGWAPPAGG
jgi:hypothetical protein